MKDEKAIADWVVNTCLLFGSSVSTAHAVAATFIDGVSHHRSVTDDEAASIRAMIRSKSVDGIPKF